MTSKKHGGCQPLHCDETQPDIYCVTFDQLRRANMARLPAFNKTLEDWGGPQWGNALAGEVGEACNVIKKMDRQLPGDPGHEESVRNLAHELADVITYADLLAARFGINLGEAVREKFNIVSRRRNSDVTL